MICQFWLVKLELRSRSRLRAYPLSPSDNDGSSTIASVFAVHRAKTAIKRNLAFYNLPIDCFALLLVDRLKTAIERNFDRCALELARQSRSLGLDRAKSRSTLKRLPISKK
ncbi:hypothetical protein [Chamaesiphon minutus]|uniref:hypothetical protein n=1 Tax=Chamaesiphon minutus TaxID=1173032 RepID=UPI0002D39642|nr:hypothetical protein [Chamaesiphon minutus]